LVSQLSDEFMVYFTAAPSNSDAIEGSFLIEKKTDDDVFIYSNIETCNYSCN